MSELWPQAEANAMEAAAARSSWQTSSLESRGGMSFKAKMFSSFGVTRRQLPRVTAPERKHIKKIECAVFCLFSRRIGCA